jgi:hypothetical protein
MFYENYCLFMEKCEVSPAWYRLPNGQARKNERCKSYPPTSKLHKDQKSIKKSGPKAAAVQAVRPCFVSVLVNKIP